MKSAGIHTYQRLKRNQKYTSQGSTSTENNRCIKWDMVDKGRNKKPEKDESVLICGAEAWSLYEDDRQEQNQRN